MVLLPLQGLWPQHCSSFSQKNCGVYNDHHVNHDHHDHLVHNVHSVHLVHHVQLVHHVHLVLLDQVGTNIVCEQTD